MLDKKELRKEYLKRRLALSSDEVEEYSLEIANKSLELDIWNYSNYHIFLPIKKQNEVNTQYLLHILQGKDKNVIISRSNFEDFSMSHYLLTDQTKLVNNKYGIPEPDNSSIVIDEKNIDVVFVPLIAVDIYGNRLGYGKGFYDRFLKKCRPNVLKIGLSFYEPLKTKITTDDNDVSLNFVLNS